MTPSFWQDKRVFLTGHTGFKGSWLTLWLQSMGAHVTGFALSPNTEPNLYTRARAADGIDSVIGDIRDAVSLRNAMERARPDIVIHMAAQPLVRESYLNPVDTYATNVMGTINVLEAIRSLSTVRAAVIVTTDKCYENHEWEWGYRENEPMGGYDPYSSSKACTELVTSAYRNSFFNPARHAEHGVAIASARAGNVIGGGDWATDRLVPDIVRALRRGEAVKVRSPRAIRPWQHVLEPLAGYLRLAEALYASGPQFGEAWNFGPYDSDAQPVGFIVAELVRQWGGDASWVLDTDQHPHEAAYLKLDCSKARARLDWKPRWNLALALENIVSWYKAEARDEDMRAFTLNQIDRYVRL
ncbi:CDP-glucose 4,6-dehydratase [Paraburkholderia heleia]|uniref:CDP-glucose 4,6-dehydratase n=1 Tax=Paraburkholderia heleia TaxID=634127 RepID=UPI0005A74CB2|nr:CDP-glucose 4,6-dehydratase [Paraburkholderia heleia]